MNEIVFIFGASAVGKSTVAKELCKTQKRSVRIDIDRIKHLVERGFVYDDSIEGKQQWEILGKNIFDLVHNFFEAGFFVVIDGFLPPDEIETLNACIEELSPHQKSFMLHLEDESEHLVRNLQRNEIHRMKDADIREHRNNIAQNWDFYESQFNVLDALKSPKENAEIILKSF